MEGKPSMDLAAFDTVRSAEEGAELTVLDPKTGEATPVRIRLLGADSTTWREKEDELMKQRINRNARRKVKFSSEAYPPEEQRADALELLVAVTAGWSGLANGGVDWPCTPENARKLYTISPGTREQAAAFVADRANFSPRSASS